MTSTFLKPLVACILMLGACATEVLPPQELIRASRVYASAELVDGKHAWRVTSITADRLRGQLRAEFDKRGLPEGDGEGLRVVFAIREYRKAQGGGAEMIGFGTLPGSLAIDTRFETQDGELLGIVRYRAELPNGASDLESITSHFSRAAQNAANFAASNYKRR